MRERRVHFIPGNKANEQPSQIIWFDTETLYRIGTDDKQYHYLWFGWACYQQRTPTGKWTEPAWLRFTDLNTFWLWVIERTRPKTRLYLMSHNGAFDLPVMDAFTELPARGFKLKSAIADAPPLIVTWRNELRTIRYLDTLNIWREPLKSIGESVGIPKLPMPTPTASQSEWDTYGQRDTEIIRVVVLRWLEFLRTNDLGGFAPTLASQAFKTYRHRFMSERILIDNNHAAQSIARAAYLGGRVECFRIGKYSGEFYYLDVNSMYPAVMRNGWYPVKLLGIYGRPSRRELAQWLPKLCVICDCDIDTDVPAYPVLHDGRLVFPVGQFRTTLCGPELSHALEHGHLRKLHSASVYLRAKLFTAFVDFMYSERQKVRAAGDGSTEWFFKRLMNSLYGKFGQRGRHFTECGVCEPNEIDVWSDIDLDTGEVAHFRKFGGIVQHWVDDGESRESFPAIAAYVTSYARMVLWDALSLARRSNCYYCDTDSLVVNRQGHAHLQPLINATRLGAWSVERQLSEIILHGPKDYIFDGEQKVKGVRHSAKWRSESLITQDYFVGFKGLLRAKSLDAPIVFSIDKRLQRVYLKGIVAHDGTVSPLRFDGSSGCGGGAAQVRPG